MSGPLGREMAGLRNAGAIAIAAVAIGLLAQWLFIDALLGINAPIGLTALLAAAWLLRPAGGPARVDETAGSRSQRSPSQPLPPCAVT